MLHQAEKLTRQHYAILAMCWAGWVFDFYDLILFTFLKRSIGRELGLDDNAQALILGFSLASTAAGGILFGYLADRFGRKPVLQWTIVTYSFGTLMSGFSKGLADLLLWRCITGIGVGGEWATGQVLIGETFPAKRRGAFGAVMQTGVPMGTGLAALMGSFFEPAYGWRTTFLVSALPALLVILIRRFMVESDVWQAQAAQPKPAIPRNRFRQLLQPNLRRFFFLLLAITIVDGYTFWATYSWLPEYLKTERHMEVGKSGLWYLVIVTGQLAGYSLCGLISDRLGRRPTFTLFSIMMAGGLFMVTLFWSLVEIHPSLLFVFMFCVGFGTGTWSLYGPICSELFPTAVRNTAAGTIFNVARGVQVFTPSIVLALQRAYGFSGGIASAAFVCLFAALLIWWLPETKGKVIQ